MNYENITLEYLKAESKSEFLSALHGKYGYDFDPEIIMENIVDSIVKKGTAKMQEERIKDVNLKWMDIALTVRDLGFLDEFNSLLPLIDFMGYDLPEGYK